MPFGLLVFRCGICKSETPADPEKEEEHCVYKNESKAYAANVIVDKKLRNDPSLSRSKGTICPKCGHDEVVFFQNNTSSGLNALATLIYICVKPE